MFKEFNNYCKMHLLPHEDYLSGYSNTYFIGGNFHFEFEDTLIHCKGIGVNLTIERSRVGYFEAGIRNA